MRVRLDKLRQDLGLAILRVSKVHHLIQQLVHNDKVVPQHLLVELVEIGDEDVAEAVQEEEDGRRVHVGVGARHDVQVVVLNVGVRHAIVVHHRPELRFRVGLVQLLDEGVRALQGDVTSIVPTDQHTALRVQEEEGGDRAAARRLGHGRSHYARLPRSWRCWRRGEAHAQ